MFSRCLHSPFPGRAGRKGRTRRLGRGGAKDRTRVGAQVGGQGVEKKVAGESGAMHHAPKLTAPHFAALNVRFRPR